MYFWATWCAPCQIETPKLEDQGPLVSEIEAYEHDQANALFLYSPHTLFAVSDRVSFQPYDTFMLELAETKIVKPRKASAE